MENQNRHDYKHHKNNYYYKNNNYHKNNHYYKNNKYYFNYYRKKKNKHRDNVLLSNQTLDISENKMIDESIKDEVVSNNEQEYTPIKKQNDVLIDDTIEEQDTYIPNRLPVFKMALGIIILCAIVFGVSYSFFNFYKEDTRQADITGGDVYVRVSSPPETTNLSLSKMYPRTVTEARSRNDNYIDFVIKAKNTSATRILYYTIDITNGETVQGKTRIDPQYIKFDLQEKVNDEYVYITEAGTLNSFNYSGMIPVNTTSELTKEYRLRIWMTDTVLISDTEEGRTFTQSQFNSFYATYHIEVNAIDKKSTTMSLSSNSGTVDVGGSTPVTITTNSNGALSCVSSDTTKATCSISGTTLTINGVAEGNATITVNQAATQVYTAESVTYTATVNSQGS